MILLRCYSKMKRLTKKDKLNEAAAFYQAIRTGSKPTVKRGPISTRPVVPCPTKPEREVLTGCIKWLRARRVFCDRHDCAAGDLGHGYATYGIKGAGDIIGILPGGQHFEIECKAGKGGRLSVGQQKRVEDVRAAGGVYLVVHGVGELEHYMKGLI